MFLKDWLSEAQAALKDIRGDEALHDINYFLREKLELSPFDIANASQYSISDAQLFLLEDFKARYAAFEPVTKIIGKRGFWKDEFVVTKDVLDPRPDSEVLIETALKKCGPNFEGKILELGTGSGCLVLSLLREWPKAHAVAVDLSEDALAVAKQNAQNLGLQDRVTFAQSNWFENVEGQFDLIISNPPYIPRNDIDTLQQAVQKYDPILALDGGQSGLEAYEAILKQIEPFLNKEGIALFEIGYDQAEAFITLAKSIFKEREMTFEIKKDIKGLDRLIMFAFYSF